MQYFYISFIELFVRVIYCLWILCYDHSLLKGAFLRFDHCRTWRRDGGESCQRFFKSCRFLHPKLLGLEQHFTFHCNMPNGVGYCLLNLLHLFWYLFLENNSINILDMVQLIMVNPLVLRYGEQWGLDDWLDEYQHHFVIIRRLVGNCL